MVSLNIGMRWLILALVLIVSGVSYMLRTNMSVIGDAMSEDLGLTEIQLGLVFSAFAAGYALFQFPGGLFGDKFGARKAIVIMAFAWAVFTFATGLVPDTNSMSVAGILAMLIVTRFLVGVSHAPVFPIVSGRVISRWFPVGALGLAKRFNQHRRNVRRSSDGSTACLVDEFVWLALVTFLTAPLGIILGLIWWFSVRDNPKNHSFVSEKELDLITAGKPPIQAAGARRGDWREIVRNREILLLTFSYFCMNYVFYLFFNWFFFYLVDVKEFPQQEAGMLMAALWVIGSIGATLGGLLCDLLNGRLGLRWGPSILGAAGLALCSIFLVIGATSSAPYTAVLFLCLCFGCIQVTEASYWSTAIAVSGHRAAEGCGVMNTGGNIVGLIGGVFVPFTAAGFGWTIAICTGAIFAILGAITWLFIRGDSSIHDSDDAHVTTAA